MLFLDVVLGHARRFDIHRSPRRCSPFTSPMFTVHLADVHSAPCIVYNSPYTMSREYTLSCLYSLLTVQHTQLCANCFGFWKPYWYHEGADTLPVIMKLHGKVLVRADIWGWNVSPKTPCTYEGKQGGCFLCYFLGGCRLGPRASFRYSPFTSPMFTVLCVQLIHPTQCPGG